MAKARQQPHSAPTVPGGSPRQDAQRGGERTPAAWFHWLPQKWITAMRCHWPILVVMAVTLVWNFTLWVHTKPNVFPDAWGYRNLALALREGNLSREQFSFRTPGFPAYLAMVFAIAGDKNWQAVMDVQFVIGSFIPLGLYFLLLPVCRRRWLAALGAASFLLDRYFLALQAVPLSEFLAGALAVFILAWQVWAWRRMRFGEAAALGFVTGLWILVRPSFQLLPWCLIAAGVLSGLLESRRNGAVRRRAVWIWHGIYLVAWQVPLLAWSANVYRFTGHWGLSHQLGATLTNQSGRFMQFAPEKYGPLRDMYVAETERHGGNWINVYDAIDDDLSSATGMKMWELSLAYKEIDKLLLKRFWREYLTQIQYAWLMLWSESSRYLVDWAAVENVPEGELPPLVDVLVYLRSTPAWTFIYGPLDHTFWNKPDVSTKTPYVLLGATALLLWWRRRDTQAILAVLFISGTVFYHMLTHAAIQFTEFGRYRLPVQPLWWSFLWTSALLIVVELWQRTEKYFTEAPEPAKPATPSRQRPLPRKAGRRA